MTFNSSLLTQKVNLIHGAEKLTICRACPVVYEMGRPVTKGHESFQIIANVQPVTGERSESANEGDRVQDQIDVWTRTKLEMKDTFVRGDMEYEIDFVEVWGPYYMARAGRIDVV